jgi:carbamoylphosphate synthase small subunit
MTTNINTNTDTNTSPATELQWPTLIEFRGYQSVEDRKNYNKAKKEIISQMQDGSERANVYLNRGAKEAIIQELVALGFWVKVVKETGLWVFVHWRAERPRFARLRMWHGPYRYARLMR